MNIKSINLASSLILSTFLLGSTAVHAKGLSINLGDALSVNIGDGDLSVKVGDGVAVDINGDNIDVAAGGVNVEVDDQNDSVVTTNHQTTYVEVASNGRTSYKNADLNGYDFSYQDLSRFNFTNANLTNVNFTGATLSYTKFTNADFNNVNFSDANLSHTKFINATFNNCDLRGAVLKRTKFTNADLGNTKVAGVDFSRANMKNADITNISIVDPVSLSSSNIEVILTTQQAESTRVNLDIRFAYDSDVVEANSMQQISQLSEALLATTLINNRIIIEGHTDSDGSNSYNLDLSQRRSQSVINILVNNYGISSNRLIAKGYGESSPIYSNKTNFGKSGNRRVAVVVSI